MIVRRIIGAAVVLAAAGLLVFLFFLTQIRDKSFAFYTRQLDAWVKEDGSPETIHDKIVGNCGKLVMSQAGVLENLQLITFYRDELDFRVDVCTKISVNKRYPQPEFEKPEIIKTICETENPYHRVFPRLCRWGGLHP